MGDDIRGSLARRHVNRLCRRLGVTHLIEPCVFRQPFPKLGLPSVGLVHDLDYPHRGTSPIDRTFRDWAIHATRLFADSTATRDDLIALVPSAAGRIEVLPLPSSPPDLSGATGPNRWRRAEPVLFYPAVAAPRKRHDVLITALARLASQGVPFHCYLSGAGTDTFDHVVSNRQPMHDAWQRWNGVLAGRVTGVGAQPWRELENLYAAATIVVLPSESEGFGLPLAEALRRSRPVVASRLRSFEEQVVSFGAEDQVRWTVPGDADSLVRALQDVLRGVRPFPPFSRALSERLTGWTWDTYASTLLSALRA